MTDRGLEPTTAERRQSDRRAAVRELGAQVEALTNDVENLRRALDTRDVLWEAKLILAVQNRLTAEQSQRLLMAMSNAENRKAVDVAREIVGQRTAS